MDPRPLPYEPTATLQQQPPQADSYRTSRSLDLNVRQDRSRVQDKARSSNDSACAKSSLDFTQRIERKLAEYNASQNVFKRWLFEILSWLVSALCMAAMVVIYLKLQNERVYRVEGLLTYTNILGKVASAALIVPTSEALGQLKWNWFHKSNVMWDFEIFDKASR